MTSQIIPGGLLGVIVFSCLAIISYPWILCWELIRKLWKCIKGAIQKKAPAGEENTTDEQESAWQFEQETELPASFWSDRRPLTPSPGDEKMSVARAMAAHAGQSGLLRLPADLRIMIWLNVMSSSCAVLVGNHWKRRYGHLCKAGCDGHPPDPNAYASYRYIPLLSTCRQIYCEAIEMLYQKNTFHFHNRYGLNPIPRVILPARLPSFRSVSISTFVCPHGTGQTCRRTQTWMGTVRVLQKMTGLHRLYVLFSKRLHPSHVVTGSPFLSPLMDLRGVPDFVVEIHDDPERPGEEWHRRFPSDLPFRVVIRSPAGE